MPKTVSNKQYDIVIVGGGASGLAAGISAKRVNKKAEVLILEKLDEVGKKILAAGGGRCNISNLNIDGFTGRDFLQSLGLAFAVEDGERVYPRDKRSHTVREILLRECECLGIEILTGIKVNSISKRKLTKSGGFGNFTVLCQSTHGRKADDVSSNIDALTIATRQVILAAGGKAGPQYGTTGDGAILARYLGHSTTHLAPALTNIEIKKWNKRLKGIRAEAVCKLLYEEKVLFEEKGEIQFTEYGLSGIPILNLSSHVIPRKKLSYKESLEYYEIEVSLCSKKEVNSKEWKTHIKELGKAILDFHRGDDFEKLVRDVSDAILGIVNPRLSPFIANWIKETLPPKSEICYIDEANYRLFAKYALTKIILAIKDLRGWQFAQVTRGGVPLKELDENFESRLVKGLFITGETTEFAGPCGGYNLDFAFTSGYLAGTKAGMESFKDKD